MLLDPRIALERLCAERGEDFAGLSRMLGRNSAYIQQYVRRGVPKRLKEEERRKLARYFSVSEAVLGGPPDESTGHDGLVSVKRHPVSVSARVLSMLGSIPPDGADGQGGGKRRPERDGGGVEQFFLNVTPRGRVCRYLATSCRQVAAHG